MQATFCTKLFVTIESFCNSNEIQNFSNQQYCVAKDENSQFSAIVLEHPLPHHLCRYLTYDCLYHCAEWTDSVDEYCNRKELQSKDRICQILRPTITEDPRPLFFSNSYLRNLKAKQAWLEDPPFQLKVVPQPAMQRHFSLSILFLGVFSWSCFHLLPISSLWGKKTSFFVFWAIWFWLNRLGFNWKQKTQSSSSNAKMSNCTWQPTMAPWQELWSFKSCLYAIMGSSKGWQAIWIMF